GGRTRRRTESHAAPARELEVRLSDGLSRPAHRAARTSRLAAPRLARVRPHPARLGRRSATRDRAPIRRTARDRPAQRGARALPEEPAVPDAARALRPAPAAAAYRGPADHPSRAARRLLEPASDRGPHALSELLPAHV